MRILALLASLILASCFPGFQKELSWLYQLQGADPKEIAGSGFDIAVVDYSRDGTEEGKYSREEIEMMGEKLVTLAYVSIGEAEDYRYYWKEEWKENPPEWLGPENPDWPGNYAVRYWMEEWKEIVFSYIEKVKEQGFDGVYLDKVDEFEYWVENGMDEATLARAMVGFINEIKERAGTMLGYIQNGERIVLFDKRILNLIDGIGVEDLFYDGVDPIDEREVEERLGVLREYSSAGKRVLVVDYVDDGSGYEGDNLERIEDFIKRSRREGFVPYAARSDRELDEMVVIEGIQPPN